MPSLLRNATAGFFEAAQAAGCGDPGSLPREKCCCSALILAQEPVQQSSCWLDFAFSQMMSSFASLHGFKGVAWRKLDLADKGSDSWLKQLQATSSLTKSTCTLSMTKHTWIVHGPQPCQLARPALPSSRDRTQMPWPRLSLAPLAGICIKPLKSVLASSEYVGTLMSRVLCSWNKCITAVEQ